VQGEWSASRPIRFTPGEKASGTHRIGGWVDPRTSLDAVENRKILPSREWNPDSPTHSPSLHRLSYPDSFQYNTLKTQSATGINCDGMGNTYDPFCNMSLTLDKGRAIDQAVSRWFLTAVTRIGTQVRSCGICGGQSGTGACFLPVLRFPLPILILPTAPHSSTIILGWYNRPNSGRRLKLT
jgi:hypothetical protein